MGVRNRATNWNFMTVRSGSSNCAVFARVSSLIALEKEYDRLGPPTDQMMRGSRRC